MIIDQNLIRIVLLAIVAFLLFSAFTYLIKFLKPLIIAAVLIVIAYFIYRFSTTGTLSL